MEMFSGSFNGYNLIINLKKINFYCVTLYVSMVLAVSLCPSVCLSISLRYCVETSKDIIILFSRPGSSIIIIF